VAYQRFRDTAATADRPVSLALLDALEGVQNADHVPNSPTNGAVEPMVREREAASFISGCTMATEPFEAGAWLLL